MPDRQVLQGPWVEIPYERIKNPGGGVLCAPVARRDLRQIIENLSATPPNALVEDPRVLDALGFGHC